MRFDAAASLKCWRIVVDIGGRDYTIPAQPAGPWLSALVSGSWRPILPGMLVGADADRILDEMERGRVKVSALDAAAREAVAEVCGMKWWSAVRLAAWLWGNWDTVGSLVLARGLAMDRDPIGAVLVVAYRVIQEHRKDEQERQRIDLELDKPPVNAGVSAEEMFDQQAATQAAMAMLNLNG